MQVQRIQNNYNQTFGAKVTILDGDKIIPKGVKRTFTKLCRNLGKDTDEIILDVFKANNKIDELETDVYLGEVRKGFRHHYYGFDCDTGKGVIICDAFDKRNSFMEELPVLMSRECEMPSYLAKIYKDYILPVFYDNNITIKNLGDTAETRLLSAAAKSKN